MFEAVMIVSEKYNSRVSTCYNNATDHINYIEPQIVTKNKDLSESDDYMYQSLRINYWNPWSINSSGKKLTLLKNNPDMIAITEVWKPWKSNHHARSITTEPVNTGLGEKTYAQIILNNKSMQLWKMEPKRKDPYLLISRVGMMDKWLYVICVYLINTDSVSKNTTRSCQIDEIESITTLYPEDAILVIGDFNEELDSGRAKNTKLVRRMKKLGQIHELDSDFTCKRKNKNNKMTYTRIDWAWSRNIHDVEIKRINTNSKFSDHRPYQIDLKFGRPTPRIKHIMPNRKTLNQQTKILKTNAPNPGESKWDQWFRLKNENKNRLTLEIKKRRKQFYKREMEIILNNDDMKEIQKQLNENYKGKIKDISRQRFSKTSKNAWNFIQRHCKYGKDKQGSFVNTLNHNGKTISKPEEVNKIIMEDYEKLHGKNDNLIPFPCDFIISDQEAREIARSFNSHKTKAICNDMVPHEIFKIHNKDCKCQECKSTIEQTKEIFTKKFWDKDIAQESLNAKLFPINKVAPEIPKVEQIRPIVAQSPIISAIEQYIAPYQDDEVENICGLEQCGFRKNLSTHTQTLRLISHVKGQKSKKELQGLFVDMSSAYDRVLRHEIKNISSLNKPNLENLLEFTTNNINVQLGTETVNGKNGVRQGSRLSPKLWNIYYQPLINLLKEKGFNNIYAYADDLVVVDKKNNLNSAWKIICDWSKLNNQFPNPKKSQIMSLSGYCTSKPKFNKKNTSTFYQIPRVDSVKYLGLWLEPGLNGNTHLEQIKEKSSYKFWSLRQFLNTGYKMASNMWQTLICPYYDQMAPIFAYCSYTNKSNIANSMLATQKKFLTLKRPTNRNRAKGLMRENPETRMERIWNRQATIIRSKGENVIERKPLKDWMNGMIPCKGKEDLTIMELKREVRERYEKFKNKNKDQNNISR